MYSENLSEFLVKKDDLLVALTGATVGKTSISQSDNYLLNQRVGLIRSRKNLIYQNYLKILLFSDNFYNYCQTFAAGGAQGNISPANIKNFQIPLPPLEVQQEIVAEIEGYRKIIDGCRQVIDAWKPDVEIYLAEELKTYLAEHPEKQEELAEGWPMVKLGEVFKLTSGKFLPQKEQVAGDYLVYGGNGVSGKHNEYYLDKPTLIIGRVGEYCGSVHITMPKSWVTDNALLVSEYFINVEQKYLLFVLTNLEINRYAKRGGQPSVSQSTIYKLSIPLPPLEVQQRIVDKIEAERRVIDSLREMVKAYEYKIKKVIDRVWGE